MLESPIRSLCVDLDWLVQQRDQMADALRAIALPRWKDGRVIATNTEEPKAAEVANDALAKALDWANRKPGEVLRLMKVREALERLVAVRDAQAKVDAGTATEQETNFARNLKNDAWSMARTALAECPVRSTDSKAAPTNERK